MRIFLTQKFLKDIDGLILIVLIKHRFIHRILAWVLRNNWICHRQDLIGQLSWILGKNFTFGFLQKVFWLVDIKFWTFIFLFRLNDKPFTLIAINLGSLLQVLLISHFCDWLHSHLLWLLFLVINHFSKSLSVLFFSSGYSCCCFEILLFNEICFGLLEKIDILIIKR